MEHRLQSHGLLSLIREFIVSFLHQNFLNKQFR